MEGTFGLMGFSVLRYLYIAALVKQSLQLCSNHIKWKN
jgi:hypothetical protein